MRHTIQQQAIYDYLLSVRTHPAAEQIYENVRKKVPQISKATVYRILNQFVKEEKILQLTSGKETRFDAFTHDHAHFECLVCGKIFDVKPLRKASKKLNEKKFLVKEMNLVYRGLCPGCNKGGNEK